MKFLLTLLLTMPFVAAGQTKRNYAYDSSDYVLPRKVVQCERPPRSAGNPIKYWYVEYQSFNTNGAIEIYGHTGVSDTILNIGEIRKQLVTELKNKKGYELKGGGFQFVLISEISKQEYELID